MISSVTKNSMVSSSQSSTLLSSSSVSTPERTKGAGHPWGHMPSGTTEASGKSAESVCTGACGRLKGQLLVTEGSLRYLLATPGARFSAPYRAPGPFFGTSGSLPSWCAFSPPIPTREVGESHRTGKTRASPSRRAHTQVDSARMTAFGGAQAGMASPFVFTFPPFSLFPQHCPPPTRQQ